MVGTHAILDYEIRQEPTDFRVYVWCAPVDECRGTPLRAAWTYEAAGVSYSITHILRINEESEVYFSAPFGVWVEVTMVDIHLCWEKRHARHLNESK